MKNLLSLLLLVVVSVWQAGACTTAVISGKYTKDGRPMIWKLRDTESFENKMMYFTDGKYPYIGMINSNDEKGEQVWGGSNAMGFAIMNSASFNVNMQDTTSLKDQEGRFMKLALQQCANLEEFEQLLKDTPKPMGLAAHFGVLDADGNVAFYEVNNHTFTKFDANDPAQAPNGYILRTNYSFTGKKDIGYGFIRFQTAQDIFYQADACGDMNAKTVIQNFSRCLKHPVLKRDFRKEFETVAYGENFVNSGDLITRHGSSSMIMIEGVKEGEDKDMATIWTQVGFPNTSIALPVWVKGGKNLPKVLLADGKENCPLNAMAMELKDRCYPISRSAGYKYLKVSELINAEKTGIIQKLEKAEEELFKNTEEHQKKWRSAKVNKKEIEEFYQWLDDYTYKTYKGMLDTQKYQSL
ncbi:carcinine hydrolase/isopenicillin-N N-acyltransferase family protein [Marinifilum sp. D737]|uniref:carcinine hydrolase/isopenicillin-N N-acyltransferase family protein n=1 Tax=Marinifilum sp. D737 TaxID=2969628 RepID=UPI0022737760|nr:carcinine hydrolase/isopenicillin-N N-acyltransferase family protein [Marinifilum sp. D737]MCY1635846.1 C45 family peptidase [Marinifilum sp. D737]